MNLKEGHPLSEVTPEQVYSKAREILDSHGQHGTQRTPQTIPLPWRTAGISPRQGPNISIIQVPVVPIHISGNEYRLWLQRRAHTPQDEQDKAIRLSVHFQQLPYGLERVEYDAEGRVRGYWYKPEDKGELRHMGVARSFLDLPKELEFGWYIVKTYSIEPNDNSNKVSENVPPEIIAGLGDSNDFLLTILEKMQTELKNKSA